MSTQLEIDQAHGEAIVMDHTPKGVPSLNNVRNLGDGLIHMRSGNGQSQITACGEPIYNVRGWISNDHVTCPGCIARRDRHHAEALFINPHGGYTLIGLGQDLQLHTRYVQN